MCSALRRVTCTFFLLLLMHLQTTTHPLENVAITATTTVAAAEPAVLATESITVQIESPKPPAPTPRATMPSMSKTSQPAVIEVPQDNNHTVGTSGMRTVELSTGRVREGFANGDIIVTLLPVNSQWPWITPAKFRPELVPEELMAQGLTVSTFILISFNFF